MWDPANTHKPTRGMLSLFPRSRHHQRSFCSTCPQPCRRAQSSFIQWEFGCGAVLLNPLEGAENQAHLFHQLQGEQVLPGRDLQLQVPTRPANALCPPWGGGGGRGTHPPRAESPSRVGLEAQMRLDPGRAAPRVLTHLNLGRHPSPVEVQTLLLPRDFSKQHAASARSSGSSRWPGAQRFRGPVGAE